jgi:hypothetical protein
MLVRYSGSYFLLSPIAIGILSGVPTSRKGYILHKEKGKLLNDPVRPYMAAVGVILAAGMQM